MDVVYVTLKFSGDTVPVNSRVLRTYTVIRSKVTESSLYGYTLSNSTFDLWSDSNDQGHQTSLIRCTITVQSSHDVQT